MPPARPTYAETVAALESSLRFGTNPSLDGIRALTDAMGRPQDAFEAIQVTGTNGKTSVARMTAAVLKAHGRSVGTYTSPHLLDYAERIEIGGTHADHAMFAEAVAAALGAASRAGLAAPATEFELLTAAALWLFRSRGVEWAVLEVGMGGRWDATSVTAPLVAVVTGVALDHTRHLGATVDAIAEEKARVIRAGSTAVLGPGTEAVDGILAARAAEAGAPIVRVRGASSASGRLAPPVGPAASPAAAGADVRFALTSRPDGPDGLTSLTVEGVFGAYEARLRTPAYQAPNAAVALAAAEAALGAALDAAAVARALADIRFPGRFQVLLREPWLIADGAHNPQAAAVLGAALDDAFPERPPTVVLAVLDDKDAAGIVAALAEHVRSFVVTASASPRALPAEELAGVVEVATGREPQVAPSVAEAIALALADGDTVATGSLTTAAEALLTQGEEA